MSSNIDSKICSAALRLAAKRGWRDLTLEHIVAAAKISPAQAKKNFADKNQILPAIVRYIDDRAEAKIGKINPRDPAHDRLFDVMMARFDALQEHRAGILSILEEIRRDPSLARLIVPEQGKAMLKMLALARLDPGGPKTHVAAFGLLAVYYRGLWCWQKDQSGDMAKTMAALDQGLRCAARVAEIIFRGASRL